jgi:hypothetical protein
VSDGGAAKTAMQGPNVDIRLTAASASAGTWRGGVEAGGKGPLAVGRLGSRRAATSDTMSRYPAAHSSNGVESNHDFVDDFTDEAGIALTHNNVASNPSNGD